MDRLKELKKLIKNGNENAEGQIIFDNLLEELIFIENQLIKLKQLPFISVNPNNKYQQKTTPAAKQYKELLQQYTNCLKIIAKASGQDLDDEESPLRKWAKSQTGGLNADTK